MAAKMFSKKEAISQGFRITKKYFGFIFSIILIYLVYQGVCVLMGFIAGRPIPRVAVSSLYKDASEGDNFYAYLKEKGYIDNYGNIQVVLQKITHSSGLALPESLEADREKIFKFLNGYRYRWPFPKPVYYTLSVIFWIVGVIIQIGIVKIAIALARDQKQGLSELVSNGSLFIKYIVASTCVFLATMAGYLLLVIPGIIISIMFSMSRYFVVDKRMGPIASLKASRALTKGARWQLFVFAMVALSVNIVGFLCLGIGLFFTLPACFIASVYVYDQLIKYKSQGALIE